mgnify:CR=1 FL=1
MENVLFKISFPAEFHAQTAVECAMAAPPAASSDRLDDIAQITIRTHESAIRIIDKQGPLANPADRDHCIQYMVAVPLIFGRLTAADYEDSVAADPRIDRPAREDGLRRGQAVLAATTSIRTSARSPMRSPSSSTTARSSKEVVVEYPIGHRRRRKEGIPVLVEKFQTNLARRFPGEAAARDPRRRARRRQARSDAGARVRRPAGASESPMRSRRRQPCSDVWHVHS